MPKVQHRVYFWNNGHDYITLKLGICRGSLLFSTNRKNQIINVITTFKNHKQLLTVLQVPYCLPCIILSLKKSFYVIISTLKLSISNIQLITYKMWSTHIPMQLRLVYIRYEWCFDLFSICSATWHYFDYVWYLKEKEKIVKVQRSKQACLSTNANIPKKLGMFKDSSTLAPHFVGQNISTED